MTTHEIGTREQWLKARLELLEAEKKLTRRSDELARRRQELPWVRVDKEYRFETDEGNASLSRRSRQEAVGDQSAVASWRVAAKRCRAVNAENCSPGCRDLSGRYRRPPDPSS